MEIVRSLDQVEQCRKVLVHEHIFCRFRPGHDHLAEKYLKNQFLELAKIGVDLVVDTTTYVSPDQFQDMDLASSVKVGCCAGYYTERYVRSDLRARPEVELTQILLTKVSKGVGRRRNKVIMLKCGSGGSAPSATERKLISAVSSVQRHTNLPMQVHSCDGAEEQFDIMRKIGVPPSKVMFCHLEMGLKTGKRLPFDLIVERAERILDRGSFAYFNDFGVSGGQYNRDVLMLIKRLVEKGYQDQMCVGSDSNWSIRRGTVKIRGVDEESSNARKYTYSSTHIVPSLVRSGISHSVADAIAFTNGLRFTVGATTF